MAELRCKALHLPQQLQAHAHKSQAWQHKAPAKSTKYAGQAVHHGIPTVAQQQQAAALTDERQCPLHNFNSWVWWHMAREF